MQSVLNRIGSNFFALLIPGLFIFLSGASVLLAIEGEQTLFLWIASNIANLAEEWPLALGILLLCYLLGQVVYAFPVRFADEWCRFLFGWRYVSGSWGEILYRESFPYLPTCERNFVSINTLGLHVSRDEVLSPCPKDESVELHILFNYWKLALYLNEPALYSAIQIREDRVRLYAGLFWSGIIGIVFSLAAVILSPESTANVNWTPALLAQSSTSVLVMLLFGYQLRRVRGREVDAVFLGYVAHRDRLNRENCSRADVDRRSP